MESKAMTVTYNANVYASAGKMFFHLTEGYRKIKLMLLSIVQESKLKPCNSMMCLHITEHVMGS